MVTGAAELVIEEFEAKFGLMAETTQCCASGTCDVQGPGATLPLIPQETDSLDLAELLEAFGPLD